MQTFSSEDQINILEAGALLLNIIKWKTSGAFFFFPTCDEVDELSRVNDVGMKSVRGMKVFNFLETNWVNRANQKYIPNNRCRGYQSALPLSETSLFISILVPLTHAALFVLRTGKKTFLEVLGWWFLARFVTSSCEYITKLLFHVVIFLLFLHPRLAFIPLNAFASFFPAAAFSLRTFAKPTPKRN